MDPQKRTDLIGISALLLACIPLGWREMGPLWELGFRITAGVCAILFVALLLRGVSWRWKMIWPQILMVICFAGFMVGLTAFLQTNAHAPNPAPKVPTKHPATTSEGPKIGSLTLLQFMPLIQRKVSTNEASVQPGAELRNDNDFVIEVEGVLKGAANTVTGYPLEVRVRTFIGAHETKTIMYQRLEAVPLNGRVDLGRPALMGGMDYDISYWRADAPNAGKRRTSKRCLFEIREPLNNTLPQQGTMREQPYKLYVTLQNEIEE